MKRVSLTPAVFHLPPEVNAVAASYAANPIVPRGPGLAPVLKRVGERIGQALGCDSTHAPVILTCSGSGAVAAALGSCIDERGILVIANGAYGERQAQYARRIGLSTHVYELGYGERPDADEVRRLAKAHGVGAIGMVHGATSTCSVNPIAEIGQVASELGLCFLVDAIASVFVEDLDLTACHVDVLIGSGNKGLHSNPDLAFVEVERGLLARVESRQGLLPYLDLGEVHRAQAGGSHPYTLNVRALLELDGALDALDREGGVAGRISIYRSRTRLLREGYARLGLELFEHPGMPLQNIGTALKIPASVDYQTLATRLAQWNKGDESYQIYSAQGKLSDSVFRVFNMGEYELPTYTRFLEALEACL